MIRSIQTKNILDIFEYFLSEFAPSGIGLYSASFGRLLFLAHYLQYHPEENDDRFDHYAERCFDAICSKPAIHTYCNGMAGVLECLRHLTRSGRLEVDYSEIEEQYKPYLLQCLQRDFARDGDYDLLHGAMGVAYHFREDETFAAETARWLRRTTICDGDRFKWQSTLSPVEKGIRGYNICLSHGISGIVLVLCALARHHPANTEITELLRGAVRYILAQEHDDPEVCRCHFPSTSQESQPQRQASRLAWCYGDLGVAVALWNAGKVLGDETLKTKAHEVMLHAAGRRTLRETMVYDAGLCHGSAGVAMIFHYMYRQTGDERLRAACDFWHQQTLAYARWEAGIAGYKFFFPSEQPEWRTDLSLLSGVAGVGLWLLSMQHEADDPAAFDWTELFFLL